jgi:hypothetical protein
LVDEGVTMAAWGSTADDMRLDAGDNSASCTLQSRRRTRAKARYAAKRCLGATIVAKISDALYALPIGAPISPILANLVRKLASAAN